MSAASAARQQPNAHSDLLGEFTKLLHFFLKTLSEDVFPDSDGCALTLAGFEAARADPLLMEETMQEWYRAIRPHMAHIAQRNEAELIAALGDMPILRPLNPRALLQDPDLDADARGDIWDYIEKLTQMSAIACAVPQPVMARLQRVTVALYPDGPPAGGGADPVDMLRRVMTSGAQDELAGLAQEVQQHDLSALMEITSLGMAGVSQPQLELLASMAGGMLGPGGPG